MTSIIDGLIARAGTFRSGPFVRQQPLFCRLVRERQSPKILMIACSDSRVDPAVIFGAEPGQIFMIRNVASLVPPNAPDQRCQGTSAALEFGVLELGVEHVIVLGHGHCGGIDALLRGADKGDLKTEFIRPWLSCASDVRDRVVEENPNAPHADQPRLLEYETVRQSIRNLLTFPWIDRRIGKGELSLHGWHFDIVDGALSAVGESGTPVHIGNLNRLDTEASQEIGANC